MVPGGLNNGPVRTEPGYYLIHFKNLLLTNRRPSKLIARPLSLQGTYTVTDDLTHFLVK